MMSLQGAGGREAAGREAGAGGQFTGPALSDRAAPRIAHSTPFFHAMSDREGRQERLGLHWLCYFVIGGVAGADLRGVGMVDNGQMTAWQPAGKMADSGFLARLVIVKEVGAARPVGRARAAERLELLNFNGVGAVWGRNPPVAPGGAGTWG